MFSNGINMEHTSDLVYEGKLIHENSYPQRPEHYTEIEMDGIKIDFYEPKRNIIHEIKKSDSYERAHEWQIKYYIYVMQRNGMEGITGVLEYPKMRETRTIEFTPADHDEIDRMIGEITSIVSGHCPEKRSFPKCKNCSYIDFCWCGERNE
jgi:CRISPR-associated exonuclease Cas4